MRLGFLSTTIAITLLTTTPSIPAQEQGAGAEQEDPTKGSKNVDEVVDYSIPDVLAAARQAMETYGCEIKKEKDDYLEGTRSRHMGVVIGSGGEKIKVRLEEKDGGTRVRVQTGKGFVGRLGKKNWPTPIYKEMLRILEESTTESLH